MADIPCGVCGAPAVCGVMMYGPDGGTVDYCTQHTAEWCMGVIRNVWPDALVPAARGEDGNPAAAGDADEAADQVAPKSPRTRRQRAQAEAEPAVEASPEVPGSEHPQ